MPCYDNYPSPSHSHLENPINHDLEAMLCSACRVLERVSFDFDENPQLSKWWSDHKKEDELLALKALRVQQEKARCIQLLSAPINQLTKADIALLRKHNVL